MESSVVAHDVESPLVKASPKDGRAVVIGNYSKGAQRLLDAVICVAAWVAAYQIRFEGQLPSTYYWQMLALSVPVAAGQVGMSTLLGIYRYQWRYISGDDVPYITRAYACFSALLLSVRLLFGSSVRFLCIPGSVVAMFFVLGLCGGLGARLARRLSYRRASAKGADRLRRRYVVVGAGMHGATVVREMRVRKGIEVVGFLDDDARKQGAVIAGVRVIGRTADLAKIVKSRNVDEILVCISPKGRQSLQIKDVESDNGLMVRNHIIPTLDEVLDGKDTTAVLQACTHASRAAVDEPSATDGDGKNCAVGAIELPAVAPGGNGNSNAIIGEFLPGLGPSAPAVSNVAPVIADKTILITGGAGFIGSSLAEKLIHNNRVILLDRSFAPAPVQYTSLLRHPNVSTVQGDILNMDLCAIVKQVDVVVHAAAILGVSRVCNSGRETLETNYVGTSRLLKALESSTTIKRLIYFSTSEVFGVNSYRVDETSRPTVGPIAESRWSYAMSKLAGEHLVASYFREAGLPTTIVRPFNIFGPRRTGDYALRRFIVSALLNKPLEVHGDGTQIRSWCYIEDFCAALLQMIVRSEAVGEDFNIGNPAGTITIFELAQKVVQFTGSSSPILFCASPFPDISIRVPSLDKARRLLGYEPKYDLNTGLKLTIQWCRDNANHVVN
jgi:nucleoside-diphosphate-sugar epimerase